MNRLTNQIKAHREVIKKNKDDIFKSLLTVIVDWNKIKLLATYNKKLTEDIEVLRTNNITAKVIMKNV